MDRSLIQNEKVADSKNIWICVDRALRKSKKFMRVS